MQENHPSPPIASERMPKGKGNKLFDIANSMT